MNKGSRIPHDTALRIRQLRCEWNLTYKQISQRLGVVESTVCDYSRSMTLPEILDRLTSQERDRLLLFLQSRISRKLLKEIYESFVQGPDGQCD